MEIRHLVLTRRMGESILIGDNIRVCVIKHETRNQVKLSIYAPEDIAVDRAEIAVVKMLEENPGFSEEFVYALLEENNFSPSEIHRGYEIYNKQQENKND